MPKNRHIRAIAQFYHAASIIQGSPGSMTVGLCGWEKPTINRRTIESATGERAPEKHSTLCLVLLTGRPKRESGIRVET
jgi:hypothetical protein